MSRSASSNIDERLRETVARRPERDAGRVRPSGGRPMGTVFGAGVDIEREKEGGGVYRSGSEPNLGGRHREESARREERYRDEREAPPARRYDDGRRGGGYGGERGHRDERGYREEREPAR
ncbi:hypothetical protein HK097_006868, partial [Rhizophlyctis rosea]